jgi:DNA mismatch repair protein MLH3
LASVAALSLLSITSHHEGHVSHNSIQIHNSEVIARRTPLPPEKGFLSFSHGTRATVRDLFGSMPVRVKQRPTAVDKTASNRDWEHLKLSVVAILLPWPGQVSVSIRDSAGQQSTVLRNNGFVAGYSAERAQRSSLLSRVSGLFCQASLTEETDPASWVALRASAGQLSIFGAVCLIPVATKRVQFISLGIKPLPNTRGSNILYEEVNRVFANSSFGVEEEVGELNDRHYITEGYTGRELKGRKGIDKHPMFHIQVDLGEIAGLDAVGDPEDILDERQNRLHTIVDVLKAMISEFLKRHQFRPMRYKSRREKLSRHSGPHTSESSSSSRACSPMLPLRPVSRKGTISIDEEPGQDDMGISHLDLLHDRGQRSGYTSPFDSWSRIKRGHQTTMGRKGTTEEIQPTQATARRSTFQSPAAPKDATSAPLFDFNGDLMRAPFTDVEIPPNKTARRGPNNKASEDQSVAHESDDHESHISWINPTTKQRLLVDTRTGFVVRPQLELEGHSRSVKVPRLTTKIKQLGMQQPSPSAGASPWIGELLSTWRNPVFETPEPRIPTVIDAAVLTDPISSSAEYDHGCCDTLALILPRVEGRVSKEALRTVEVISQVDQKFIFAKVSLKSAPRVAELQSCSSLLIMVDQHAADERCQVEALMADYFEPDQPGTSHVQARIQILDKDLRYEISTQERLLFERYISHFEHWGIEYQLNKAHTGMVSSFLKVMGLPPSIAERCQTEPRLLIELLRKEIWKLDEKVHGYGHSLSQATPVPRDDGDGGADDANFHWLSKFHGCPRGILDMINSRACRSAIMFNDALTLEDSKALMSRLAECAFPFQCAHGRPSMVPLVDMGDQVIDKKGKVSSAGFGKQFNAWKSRMSRDHS